MVNGKIKLISQPTSMFQFGFNDGTTCSTEWIEIHTCVGLAKSAREAVGRFGFLLFMNFFDICKYYFELGRSCHALILSFK